MVSTTMQLGAAVVGPFLFDQRFRNDADRVATSVQRGVGDGAHEAVAATAVHQLAAVFTDPLADLRGRFGEGGVVPGREPQ